MPAKQPAAKKPAAKKPAAKKPAAKKPVAKAATELTPRQHIDARIASLGDWRGPALARMRGLIAKAVPDVEETWKWRGVPVWEADGILCTGESYPSYIKLTFAKGAQLADPQKLFNASLEGNARRAIDIHAGVTIDEAAFIALMREAAAANRAKRKK